MAIKRIGLGTVVKYDHDSNASFDVVGELRSVTPPGRSYERVADDTLDSVLRTQQQGIEDVSEFQFQQVWHDGDAQHERIDTAFNARDNRAWQIVFPHSPARTWEFTGRVMSMGPEQITNSSLITRTVTVHRTSAITKT